MMKKLLTALAISAIAFTGGTFAQIKKDSTKAKKYNVGKPAVKYKPTATTSGGKPDMRYKMNKKSN
jgi:hypothetical protein